MKLTPKRLTAETGPIMLSANIKREKKAQHATKSFKHAHLELCMVSLTLVSTDDCFPKLRVVALNENKERTTQPKRKGKSAL